MANPNGISTNKLTDLVALRFLVASGFVTVGAKEHFKDQMVGKRNGQIYTFVIRDAVDVGEGPTLGYNRDYKTYMAEAGNANNPNGALDTSHGDSSATEKQALVEREVKMFLRDFHAAVNTQAIEAVTDMNWDKEVAEPNGAKIANYVVRKAVEEAYPKATVTIAGAGWGVLAEAAAHLSSISGDKMFGFIDPLAQASLTSNGQMFQPVGAPDAFYKQGLIGSYNSVEYRGQRFFKPVRVNDTLATKFNGTGAGQGATFTSYNPSTKVLTVTMADTSDSTSKILKGTPIWIEGIMAADLIGDPSAEQYSFIAAADATASSGVFAITVTEDPAIAKGGTAEAVKDDGSAIVWGSVSTSAKATIPAGGSYFCGQIRLDGAYEFCTLDKLDASNSESKMGAVEGVKIHENRVVNLDNMTSKTRWDIVAMFGVVERRGVVNVLIKTA